MGVRLTPRRAFSQADPHVIQVEPAFVAPPPLIEQGAGNLQPYAEVQTIPANWMERWVPITTPIAPGNIFWDENAGFPVHSIMIDNITYKWLVVEPSLRPIPPYTVGVCLPSPKGGQLARVRAAGLPGLVDQTAVTGQQAWIGWSEAFLPPSPGVLLPAVYHT